MAEKKSTQIYHDWIPTFDMIGRKDKAVGFDLIMSLLRHGASGEGLNIEEQTDAAFTAEVIFNHFARVIDNDIEKYIARCEQNKANASERKRSVANASENNQTQAKKADKDKDKDKDIYIKRSKNKFKNFDERAYTDEEYAAMEGGRKP